jgi:single-stranded DNA-binding protein
MKVDVEGMITYSQYQDQQGVQRTTVEIVASDIVLMSKPDGGQAQAQQAQPVPPPQQGYAQQPAAPALDDYPF